MKIAILTQRLWDNYGGILQNLALQKALLDLGHNPETVDYEQITREKRRQMIKSHYKSVFSLHYHKHQYPLPSFIEKQLKHTRGFVNKHIITTPPMDEIDSSLWEKGKYDAYIVGSDQVWRPIYNSESAFNAMFLRGVQDDSVKCIAYGASFGKDEWEFNDAQTEMAQEEIKKFDAVSVRETSGIDLCKKYLNKDAELVLDPTLLHDKEFYSGLVSHSALKKTPGQSISCYILDNDAGKERVLKEISEKLGASVHRLGRSKPHAMQPPVEEWLATFLTADYVVTDSFHGVAFAINFNIPFTVIDNKMRGSTRIDSILNLFNLQQRREPSSFDEPINWEEVNKKKEIMRKSSIDFLISSLNS